MCRVYMSSDDIAELSEANRNGDVYEVPSEDGTIIVIVPWDPYNED